VQPVKEVPLQDRKVLNVAEVAEVLGLSRNAAYEAVHRGDIPAIRIGRRILVPVRALDEALSAGQPLGVTDEYTG
jgi:excisionase family DNA binding protein